MTLSTADTYLYELGFIRTQPGYYETPLNKDVTAIEEDGSVRYYKDGEIVATSEVGDDKTGYSLINSLR